MNVAPNSSIFFSTLTSAVDIYTSLYYNRKRAYSIGVKRGTAMNESPSLFPDYEGEDGYFAVSEETVNQVVIKLHWPYGASSPHYDERFHVGPDRAISFWSSEGPSLDPNVQRLITRTGDHRLSGLPFEGVHPPGKPGHGPTIVWDRGSFRCLTRIDGKVVSLARALETGHALVEIRATKINGLFELTHIRDDRWLLIKVADEFARPGSDITHEMPLSVSDRTMAQVESLWYWPPKKSSGETGSLGL